MGLMATNVAALCVLRVSGVASAGDTAATLFVDEEHQDVLQQAQTDASDAATPVGAGLPAAGASYTLACVGDLSSQL